MLVADIVYVACATRDASPRHPSGAWTPIRAPISIAIAQKDALIMTITLFTFVAHHPPGRRPCQ
jgi:hypothetical protein